VVVDCACAGRVETRRAWTAKTGDASKCYIDVVLGDGSWLDRRY
jgi:hypothetical protein